MCPLQVLNTGCLCTMIVTTCYNCLPAGALLLNLGSLMTRWTNGNWKSTIHRVTNPSAAATARTSRRLSAAFFHKVNYNTVVEVLPTCYNRHKNSGPSAVVPSGVGLADRQEFGGSQECRYPPVRAAELTRQGILHKYRHLQPEEASRMYHEELAAMRNL